MGDEQMVFLMIDDNEHDILAINSFWQLARVPEDTT
jgi:hypothetical protein